MATPITLIEHKGYLGTIESNIEDEFLFGKIFGISDLVTFEGESIKELKAAFYEAVDDYIETCREIGKEPEKYYKGVFNVRISGELHKDAAIVACRKHITLNDFVKTAIVYAVNHPDQLESEMAIAGE
ncbi:type II toxin-antitoxin system HicB family antitoxin [Arcticibacter eurypsychrophilus]|uniref:type II toxin-antitoxin system HicB family antitoxin n=1 Tax=Arcticibacter eurypsychrophilus TaxID=1434752 RepID=UPI00084DED04|nr:type II toxin-antitoxin system HicB family antitoxin [Arcticibacter eurypsychrophilus]